MSRQENNFKTIPIELVNIGMYINLDLSWMDHPFVTSSFKIKNAAQLKSIKQLGLTKIQFDPTRSERCPPPLAQTQAEQNAQSAQMSEEELQEIAAQKEAKRLRLESLVKQRAALSECERKFAKAADSIKSINQSVYSKPSECVATAGLLVDQMLDSIMADKDVALILVGDSAGAQEVYFHSLNVAVLSMILGKEMGCSKEEVACLGMGAIFHDIGKIKIPSTILLKNERLTPSEKQFLALHTSYGVDIAKELKLPDPVIEIVRSHHESVDGTGYPDKLAGTVISKLTKIISVTNAFDNLCNKQRASESLPPYEALSYMFGKQRPRFDHATLATFIRSMGVYPPGTLVRLSNEMLGLVVSVNANKPLLPKIFLYDPHVPKNEAMILDLELDPDITIIKTLRASQLSLHELAYLNPRKRVTYYVDESSSQKPPATR